MNAKKLLTLSAALIMLVGCNTNNSSSIDSTPSSNTPSSSETSESPSSSEVSSSESSVSLPNIDSSGSNDVIQGQVGKLTSDMIAAIGNESITVSGTLVDYYSDGDTNTINTTC